jgi:hypothetical protein
MKYFKSFSLFLLAFSLFSSCKNSDNLNEEVLKISLNSTRSSKIIAVGNEINYERLHELTMDETTRDKAEIWEPRALMLKSATAKMVAFLKSYSNNLSSNANELWKEIEGFKKNLLSLDEMINKEFAAEIGSFPMSYATSQQTSERFIKSDLSRLSPTASDNYMYQLMEQVRGLENQLLLFCLDQCTFIGCVFTAYSGLINLKSSTVGPGESIEIVAGLGAYVSDVIPIITINNKILKLREDGTAIYKKKAPVKPGKYTMPAIFEYVVDRRRKVIKMNIEYTVKQ